MGIKSNSSSEPYFNFFGQSSIDAVNPAPVPFAYYYPYGSPTAKTYLEAGDDFNTKVPGDYVFVMLATKSSVQTYGWGAGGQIGSDPTSFGGGAGAWDGTMTFTTGTTYRVIIGGSGTNPTFSSPTVNNYTASPFGGGGPGATSVPGGAGGGYSGIFESDTLSCFLCPKYWN